jgi:phage pi2 protein 07
MIVLHTPKKKLTNYVAKITDDYGKQIRIKIPYCKAQYLKDNSTNGYGHLLRIVLPKNCEQYTKIKEIDESICLHTIQNNQKWFNNNLSTDEIRAFFRQSLNTETDTMTLMIIDIQDIVIRVNDVVVDLLEEVDFKNPTLYLSLEIEAQGLYFFPKKCGIRWVVNKLSLYSEYPLHTTPDDFIDKQSVETDWEVEITNIEKIIEEDIAIYNTKILNMKNYLKELQDTLHTAKRIDFTEEWNYKLVELSHKIADYYLKNTRPELQ